MFIQESKYLGKDQSRALERFATTPVFYTDEDSMTVRETTLREFCDENFSDDEDIVVEKSELYRVIRTKASRGSKEVLGYYYTAEAAELEVLQMKFEKIAEFSSGEAGSWSLSRSEELDALHDRLSN